MIPVNQPLLGEREKELLLECIDSGWVSSDGPFVSRLEELVAGRVQRRFGVAVTNGTAALDAAVEALEIGPGDEVILPAFTIISCVLQVVRSGAVPVLVDSDPVTWNMDVSQVERSITDRTKAIMVVHTYGLPVDMDAILDVAARHRLRVVEDAAEMLGQTYKGRPCGSFGDISTFSFYPNKHLTTGEGGMIVTDDESLAQSCRSLRNLCFQPGKRFVHEQLGWNLRMSNLQAAVGVAQFERLDEFIGRKRSMGKRYTELLSEVRHLQLPLDRTAYADNIFWVFGVVLNDDAPLDCDEMMRRLAAKGVSTRPFFCPMHLQPALRKRGLLGDENHLVAERLFRRGFYLPSGLGMTNQQIESVADAVKEVLA